MEYLPIEIFLTILTCFVRLDELSAISCVNKHFGNILKRYKFNMFYTKIDKERGLSYTLNEISPNCVRFKNNVNQFVFESYENYLIDCEELSIVNVDYNKLLSCDNSLNMIKLKNTTVSSEMFEKLQDCSVVRIINCVIDNSIYYLKNCTTLYLNNIKISSDHIIEFLKNVQCCENLSIISCVIPCEIFRYFDNIRNLNLKYSSLEGNIKEICITPRLNFVDLILERSGINGDDIEYILLNSDCECLNLSCSWIHDISPECFKGIIDLDLSHNYITDDVLKCLNECVYLDLYDTQVDGSGFIHLKNVEELILSCGCGDEADANKIYYDSKSFLHLTNLIKLHLEYNVFDLDIIPLMKKRITLKLLSCKLNGNLENLLNINKFDVYGSIIQEEIKSLHELKSNRKIGYR